MTGSQDGSLKVHDIRIMKDFNTFQKQPDPVTTAAWHPQSEDIFASASYKGDIHFWHTRFGHLHTIEKAHLNSSQPATQVWGLAWHPEGNQIVSTGNDRKLKFWGKNNPKDDKPKYSA